MYPRGAGQETSTNVDDGPPTVRRGLLTTAALVRRPAQSLDTDRSGLLTAVATEARSGGRAERKAGIVGCPRWSVNCMPRLVY